MLHIGTGGFYKNTLAVVRIFSEVAKQWPGKLVIAGAVPNEGLTAAIKEMTLEDRVVFLVHPDDEALLALYQRAQVFLFPSLMEGYGWPPLEAVACGCPVVASEVGGIKEVLSDGGASWFDPADEAGMAQACLRILNHPEEGQAMVRQGQFALQQVTLSGLAEKLVQVYREVISCG